MKLNKSANYNENYLAKIVYIKDFTPHINPEVNRLKVAHVDGYNVIVSIDEQPGKFVYFPTNSKINPQFLSHANLYRKAELNEDATKTGLFEENGRVRAVKLKGQVSEGFLLPVDILVDFIISSTNIAFSVDDCVDGTEFDEVEHKGKSFWINKKYVIKKEHVRVSGADKRNKKRTKRLGRYKEIIDTQFRFHYTTSIYKKEPYFILPNDLISITAKWDGTSGIFAYVLCNQPNTPKSRIIKWLTGKSNTKYDYVYSSRSVVRSEDINPDGYKSSDTPIYTAAFEYVKPYLIKGMTIYAEIVGYRPNGEGIMERSCGLYDYGCVRPNDGEEYQEGKHFKVMVYRITMTNPDGFVHEFSAREVQQWCKMNGLVPVIEYYYGYAKDLYPEIIDSENWCEEFIEHLANDKNFYMEMNSPDCTNKVPQEGIVIKKEDMIPHAVKLKTYKFISQESADIDGGIENIEDVS